MVSLDGCLALFGPRLPAVSDAHWLEIVFLFEVIDHTHVSLANHPATDEPNS